MKAQALLIDLNNKIKDSLGISFDELNEQLDVFEIKNKSEIIPLIENKEIQIIICDLDLEDREELEIIRSIKIKYSNIFVVGVTSEPKFSMQDLYKLATHLISYPINILKLQKVINRFNLISQYLNDGKLMGLVNNITELPTLPSTFVRLEEEFSSTNISMQRITNIISESVTVTANIFRVINSSFFALSHKVTNVMQAITLLGVNILKSMVLYDSLSSRTKIDKKYVNYFENLWIHSNKLGKFAEHLIRITLHNEVEMMEQAYMSGLLHDIGKVVLLAEENYPQIIFDYMEKEDVYFSVAEYKLIGTSHAEVGAYFLASWGFPETCCNSVYQHNKVHLIDFTSFSVENAVYIANELLRDKEMTLDKMKSLNLGVHPKDWLEYLQNRNL